MRCGAIEPRNIQANGLAVKIDDRPATLFRPDNSIVCQDAAKSGRDVRNSRGGVPARWPGVTTAVWPALCQRGLQVQNRLTARYFKRHMITYVSVCNDAPQAHATSQGKCF